MEKVTLFSSAIWSEPVCSLFPIPSALGKALPGGRQLLLSWGTLLWVRAWWPPAEPESPGLGQQGRCPSTWIQPWLDQSLAIPCVTLSSHCPSCCTCRSWRSCVCPLLVSLMQESCWQSTEGTLLRWQGPSARASYTPGNFPFNSACSMALWFHEFAWWLTAQLRLWEVPPLPSCQQQGLYLWYHKIFALFQDKRRGDVSACFPKTIFAILFKS